MGEWLTVFFWKAVDLLQAYNGAVTAAATVFIAVFTIVLAIVSKRQAALTRDSVRLAEQALITTERAFVFVEDFDPDVAYGVRGGGAHGITVNHLTIRPRWRNNGNTPTRDMTVIVNWTAWNGDLPDGFSYAYGENVAPTQMFLGPKAAEWSDPVKIPANEATSALREAQHVYIWGRVEYRDIFKSTPTHFTQWCYKMVFTRVAPQPSIQFVAFGPYNGSDEDSRAGLIAQSA